VSIAERNKRQGNRAMNNIIKQYEDPVRWSDLVINADLLPEGCTMGEFMERNARDERARAYIAHKQFERREASRVKGIAILATMWGGTIAALFGWMIAIAIAN
tara:strand:- start:639 stop:947 length:309 start_codon:yes stop_codon:yes gene_type:complete